MFPNVVLVGARGSGKSRAGRKLAAATGWELLGADARFEARHGPIGEFVAAHGWDAFRDRETETLGELARESPGRSVLDCGGGVVERRENRDLLRRLGTVYWVRAPLERLRDRIARKTTRPSLTGRDPTAEIGEVLARRTPLYRAVAEADVWAETGREAADALRRAHFGPGIALSVLPGNHEEALRALLGARERLGPEDLIELRADRLREVRELLEALPDALRKRLILTVRTPEQGGGFAGTAAERERMLRDGARADIRFVDAEFPELVEGKTLASFHHFEGPAPDLEALAARMGERAAAVKVAVTVRGEADVQRMFRFQREPPPGAVPRIGIAMGAAGGALRVIGTSSAGIATFAPPPGSLPTGPGQLDSDAVRDRHRRWGRKLFAPVPVYGVVGHPVAGSLSPPMHEAAFVATGRAASYQRFEVPPDELEDFLTAFRLARGAGLNVTIPHKEAIVPLLDSLDEAAHRIGAVNTVSRQDDALAGANTDWIGAARALLSVTPLKGKEVTVLGAGGSARAVLHALAEHGARATVMARDDRKAAAVAARFGAGWRPGRELGVAGGDVLVNATPVGMDSDLSPAPADVGRRLGVVFDLVYRPARTRLLRDAEAAGATPVPGLPMLVHQAAASFALWTGESVAETMEAAARDAR